MKRTYILRVEMIKKSDSRKFDGVFHLLINKIKTSPQVGGDSKAFHSAEVKVKGRR